MRRNEARDLGIEANLAPLNGEGNTLQNRTVGVVAEVDVLELQQEAPARDPSRRAAVSPLC
jgi:hypothetical protein